MAHDNRIIAFAERALHEGWIGSPESLIERIEHQLLACGIVVQELLDALHDVLTPRCPTPKLEAVARVCALTAAMAGEAALAAEIHGEAGNALSQRFDRESLWLAIGHYREIRAAIGIDNPHYAPSLLSEAVARSRLAEWGYQPTTEARIAVKLCRRARRRFAPQDRDAAEAMMVEGAARVLLAEARVRPRKNVRKAIVLCREALALFDMDNPTGRDAAVVRVHYGLACARAADSGIAPIANYRQAIRLFRHARRLFGDNSHESASLETNEASARVSLAQVGVDPVRNLRVAISLYKRSRARLRKDEPEYRMLFGRALTCQGVAYCGLADFHIEPITNLTLAVRIQRRARRLFESESANHAGAMLHEAVARKALADLGQERVDNLLLAIALCTEVRGWLHLGGATLCYALLIENSARLALGDPERTPQPWTEQLVHVEASIAATQAARRSLGSRDWLYARFLTAEAAALVVRARIYGAMGEPQGHTHAALQRAVALYQDARQALQGHPTLLSAAEYQEGLTRIDLASSGCDSEMNLREAAALFASAAERFAYFGIGWWRSRLVEARVLAWQGKQEIAHARLGEAIDAAERACASLPRAVDRQETRNTFAAGYMSMVGLCLELLQHATSVSEAERRRWEAWHWVQRAKSRALADLLGTSHRHAELSELPLRVELDQQANRLADASREAEWVRAKLTGDEPVAEALRDQLELSLIQIETRCHRLQSLYDDLLRRAAATSTPGLVPPVVGVPPPQELLHQLRLLAALDEDQHPDRKPLLVDFFFVTQQEVAVFLLPLWQHGPPTIERLKLDADHLLLVLQRQMSAITPASRQPPSAPEGAALAAVPPPVTADMQPLLHELGALVSPWAYRLDDWAPTELILVPHIVLNLLPLHALMWGGRTLAERFPITYLPSASLAQEIHRRRAPFTSGVLLLANSKGDLDGAEDEVRNVAAQLAKRRIPHQVFLRSAASSATLIVHAAASSVLHLACHGVFNHKSFLESGLELADQRFTTAQIMSLLNLRKAILVYLSACDAAKPAPDLTNELLALTRAFFYAGAPTVIASLWPLDDSAAATFADCFYRAWIADAAPLSVAFQQAMLRTRELHPDPVHWAPFVIYGAGTALLNGDVTIAAAPPVPAP